MGLVDYSDSESETEVQQPQPPKPPAKESRPNSKPFQKFVDRSNPGKILVNLPAASGAAQSEPASDGPPAKRARTAGGSRFSAFSSFLPPPKTAAKPAPSSAQTRSSSGASAAPRPGIHLKTGAEPAFAREQPGVDDEYGEDGSIATSAGGGGGAGGGGLKLPPPKSHTTVSASSGPSIPADQLPAEEVKLVGKPLMFKPLSVSRKPAKKKTFNTNGAANGVAATKPPAEPAKPSQSPAAPPEQPKKKISLFSLGAEPPLPADSVSAEPTTSSGAYEPLFASAQEAPGPDSEYSSSDLYPAHAQAPPPPPPQPTQPQSLSSIAADLNLTPQARRELFGRSGGDGAAGGGVASSARVVNFDMAREYEHNEEIRQAGAGAAAAHNPVRSIKAGKHSLRQLVSAVQTNAAALEESFAAGKGKRSEAGARYGWR